MRLIDRYWEVLFDRYNILEHINRDGFYEITSAQINTVKEARLMTKFDSKVNLPQIFRKNNISILPITRGSYVLGHFDTYKEIDYNANTERITFTIPPYIESIDYTNLYSESASLHCAYLGGIIDDIAGEPTLPTVSGRMSGGQFEYNIRNIKRGDAYTIRAINSQIEIDGGYESYNKLILIEAKNFSAEDFLIRQLYYPYRLWHGKVNKEIIPVFFTYSNDVFSFFIYHFQNSYEYNSIELVEQRNYIVAPEAITLTDIIGVFNSIRIIEEPQVPFPQADSMARIVDLLSILADSGELTADDITTNYAFTSRQTAYYTSAAIYLGLVDKRRDDTVYYFLSDTGHRIMRLKHKQKYLNIVSAILKHEVFYKVFREFLQTASPVPIHRIVQIMNECYLYNVSSQDTVHRRAQTVKKWIEWILDLQS